MTRQHSHLTDLIQGAPLTTDLVPGLETIAHVLWQIWCGRNNFIFRHQQLDPSIAIADAITQTRIYKISTPRRQQTEHFALNPAHLWRPPDRGNQRIPSRLYASIGGTST